DRAGAGTTGPDPGAVGQVVEQPQSQPPGALTGGFDQAGQQRGQGHPAGAPVDRGGGEGERPPGAAGGFREDPSGAGVPETDQSQRFGGGQAAAAELARQQGGGRGGHAHRGQGVPGGQQEPGGGA